MATTGALRGVDLAAAPLRVRGVDLAAAPLRVRGVDVAVALLREMRDAATSGIAETSESDVPQACAATPSRSRRNDVDEEDGCRDSASETTPQRLWKREPKSQNNLERESITKFGTSRRDKQTMVGR